MIHYHGTPVGGKREDAAKFLAGRHALVPFPRKDDLGIVADVCKSFVFDNGAFTVWMKGGQVDVDGYTRWVEDCTVTLGSLGRSFRMSSMATKRPTTTLFGSGQRNSAACLSGICTNRLSGYSGWRGAGEQLRWAVQGNGFHRALEHGGSVWVSRWMPSATIKADRCAVCTGCGCSTRPSSRTCLFASADSTNAAVNGGSISRFGMYAPPTAGQRANVIADRIEAHNSSPIWQREAQTELAL
ncbi:hypothetical protein [Pseudomonas sp. 31 R 17]|uniref:hypothetical protein n=1 Tax=Pseudomonas sp. 31 R 17 TaxID=1844101 RepID=UPI0008120C14|nr:hypothetical protein [Pseudomonas sp. 31 R 17]CRM19915.1 hypothetical protein [Pseudomonas sp. 31 R 17]